MQDVLSILAQIQRPKLLMRAARIGAVDYRRDRHLARILGVNRLPRSGEALLRLAELENMKNESRLERSGTYDLSSHVEIMIAIVAEARILQEKGATQQAAPSQTVVAFPSR